jgi:hypothetical protein
VIISELMYHPRPPGVAVSEDDLEFIEIHNPASAAVDLTGWQLAEGIQFQFPAGTTLAPRGYLVVAAFDPSDANMLNSFRQHYRLEPSVTVIGPFTGQLSNAGDTVQLLRASAQQPDQPGSGVFLAEDAVTYDDQEPWASRADGYGHSLHRLEATLWGSDPQAWVSAWPTPRAGRHTAGDADGSGRFDQLDIVRVLQNGKYRTGQLAAWEDGDWNADGVFDQLDIVAALQNGNYLQTGYALRTLDAVLASVGRP